MGAECDFMIPNSHDETAPELGNQTDGWYPMHVCELLPKEDHLLQKLKGQRHPEKAYNVCVRNLQSYRNSLLSVPIVTLKQLT